MSEFDYSQPPSMPSAPPPSKKPVPTALWVTLAIIGVGGCVIAIAYGYFIQTLFQQMQTQRQSRSGASAVRFVGPDPWTPVSTTTGGWKRYRMDLAGFEVDLPMTVEKEVQAYDRSDSIRMSGYFYYGADSSLFYGIYGLQMRDAAEANLEAAAYCMEHMYSDDPQFREFKFQLRNISSRGTHIKRLSGSFNWAGEKWSVEGIAFSNRDFQLGIFVEGTDSRQTSIEMDRISSSLKVESGS